MKDSLYAIDKGQNDLQPLLQFIDVELGPDEEADVIEVWVRQHVLHQLRRHRVGTIELIRTDDHEPMSWMFFGLTDGYMSEEHLLEVATKLRKLHSRDYT